MQLNDADDDDDDNNSFVVFVGATARRFSYKKALLSQRRPRDAPNIWVP